MFYGLCGPGSWGSWGFPGLMGTWGWIGMLLNLVFWIGLISILTLMVVRASRGARVQTTPISDGNGQPTAKEILQARYARSEITREQYERMKKDLE